MNEGREYLSAVQLAALTPWSVEAINKKVRRGELVRGKHYFQPNGPGSQLVFKWSAIVALIEGKDAELIKKLEAMGHKFAEKPFEHISDANAVMIDPKSGLRYGGADARRSGVAIGW